MEWLLVLHLMFQGSEGISVEMRTTKTAGTEQQCQHAANFLNRFKFAETRDGSGIVTLTAYCTPVRGA